MNMQRLLDLLNTNPQTQLADLAYTTTARRMHHVFRSAHAVGSTADLAASFAKSLASFDEPQRTSNAPSIAFTFTGQGSQYPGMGKQLFETCSTFRDSILECDGICTRLGLPSLLNMITDTDLDVRTVPPVQVQLALVSLELALASLWQSWGLKPDVVIGHSLGEYPALCVAGVLSVSDMLFLVGKRAEIMQKQCTENTHAMLAAQLPVESVRQVLSKGQMPSCEVSCINGPSATVVSGKVEDITRLEDQLRAKSVKVTRLQVHFAFHSSQLDPILNDFKAVAYNVHFAKPVIPVASTLMSTLVRDEGIFTADYLTRQARHPVNFLGALQACKVDRIIDDQTLWIDIGPDPVCLGMVRSTLGIPAATAVPTLKRNEYCWMTISKSIANAYYRGANIMWSEYHKEYESALSLLELPSYAFDLKDYWIQYEGDWAIRKGDAGPVSPTPAFSTTSLQRVESEVFTKDSASITFVSDLAEPKLRAAVRGHLVNGAGLCPSSIYADMAFTAGSYIHSRLGPSLSVPAMDVTKMEVFQPLIAKADSATQLIKVSAVKKPGANSVEVRFSSQDGSEVKEHAHCTVQYGDGKAWMSEWARTAYLVKARMDHLVDSAKAGISHKILRKMVYKLFSVLVKYDEKYQGLEEVFMDSNLLEAAASVKFKTTAADGEFVYSPYWIDSIAHLSGFVLNGSDTTPEDAVYISHGWQSMRIVGSLSEDKSYRSYVRMQPTGSRGVMAGDVYVFEGDEVIAVCGGLKFQQIKRSILRSLLPAGSQSANQAITHTRRPLPAAAAGRTRVTPANVSSTAPLFSEVLSTIASEIGVGVTELVDGANLADLGVDSLLTISILSKLRELISLDLPSSLFTACPTVAGLRAFFQDKAEIRDFVTVNGADDIDTSDERSFSLSSSSSSAPSTPSPESEDVADIFLSILAAEIGIDASEIRPATLFADLGVDSLLSLSILGSFKSQTGKILPSSFFHDRPTFADVQDLLGNPSVPITIALKPATKKQTRFKASCIYLQGRPSKKPALFLLPDGSGSASSYVNLPTFDSGILVYGMNSPFLASPLDYTLSLQAVAHMYVSEIRAQQTQGPYLLGGWSIGGTYAYEVANQLIAAGQHVAGLILVDAPCPKTLPPLPVQTIDLLSRIGVFDGLSKKSKSATDDTIPLTVRQHFLDSINALKQYTPTPIDAAKAPKHCLAIWARQGVWESVPADQHTQLREEAGMDNKARDWLMDPRESYEPNGSDRLLPNVECAVVEGNHFKIMRQPQVRLIQTWRFSMDVCTDLFWFHLGHGSRQRHCGCCR